MNKLSRWWDVIAIVILIVLYIIIWIFVKDTTKALNAQALRAAIGGIITASSILFPLCIGVIIFLVGERFKEKLASGAALEEVIFNFYRAIIIFTVSIVIGALNLSRLVSIPEINGIIKIEVDKTSILGWSQFVFFVVGVVRMLLGARKIKKAIYP